MTQHLLAIKNIIAPPAKTAAEKFELIWQYRETILRPELDLDLEERAERRVSRKENHLCWLIGDGLVPKTVRI